MPEIIEITDLHAPALEVYACLSEPQLLHYDEPAEGLFIAESLRVAERALDAGYRPMSALIERSLLKGEAKRLLARVGDIPVYTAALSVLTKLTGYHLTRGILCAMRRRRLPDAALVCGEARRVVVLENLNNPTNVGALFRSAAALGMDAILLTRGCSDPLYRRAVRVSMGTVFQIPWTYFKEAGESRRDAERTASTLRPDRPSASHNNRVDRSGADIDLLRSLGFRTVALTPDTRSLRIDDPRFRSVKKLALMLGNEDGGLLPETIAACDNTAHIPMTRGVDSLNVAAAGAVAFWALHA